MWERFRAQPYFDGLKKDGSKIYSIGFGHSNYLIDPPFNGSSIWTQDYAHTVLLNDIEYFGNLLKPHLKVKVPDSLWSVCMSLCINKGVGMPGNEKGLINSEAWKILHDGKELHLERFCESILTYATVAINKTTLEPEVKQGLVWRRIAEAGIYFQDRLPDYL